MGFFLRSALLIVVLYHVMPFTCMASDMQVALKFCTSSGNKKYVEKIITPRKPINRTTSLTSSDVYFWPNVSLTSPLHMHINCYKKFTTQYKPYMVNLKIEVCEALKTRTHPLYKFFWVKTRESDSNILEPCPLKGHKYIKPYYTSYELLPPMLPTGIWRIDIILKKGDEEILKFINYYEVISMGIAEF